MEYYCEENDMFYLVLELVGASLNTFVSKNKPLSLKSVLFVAEQMLKRLQTLHLNNFVHCDVKPDNMSIGVNNKSLSIYLYDFGLAKQFKYERVHINAYHHDHLIGTARYSSLNSHDGIELSRRDDLESLAYSLVYLAKGKLLWQGLNIKGSDEKYAAIKKLKKQCTSIICSGLPGAFKEFLDYSRKLNFKDKPDYKYLSKIFSKIFIENNFKYDYIFDWTKPVSIVEKKKAKNDIKGTQKLVKKKAKPKNKKGLAKWNKPIQDSLLPKNMSIEDKKAFVLKTMQETNFDYPFIIYKEISDENCAYVEQIFQQLKIVVPQSNIYPHVQKTLMNHHVRLFQQQQLAFQQLRKQEK